jgi:uncharacterized protein DUF3106
MRRISLILAMAFGLLMGLAAQPVLAQQGPIAQRRAARRAQRQGARAKANSTKLAEPAAKGDASEGSSSKAEPKNGAPNPNHAADAKGPGKAHLPGNLPGPWVQKLGQMSPQEQERFMRNNQRFQNLPPEQQARIRQNLQRWNNLSSEQKDRLRKNWDILRGMSPEQRQHYQNDVLPKWQQMPPGRKQVINERLGALQDMTPEERQKAMNDPQFMHGLSPDEQSMLRDLNSFTSSRRP